MGQREGEQPLEDDPDPGLGGRPGERGPGGSPDGDDGQGEGEAEDEARPRLAPGPGRAGQRKLEGVADRVDGAEVEEEGPERAAALGDADALSNLGFLDYEEKRYADAADAFRRAAALLPKDPGLQRNLGDALACLGRAAEARAAFAVAVKMQREHVRAKPNSAPTVGRLAVYEAKAGDPESAGRHAAAALEMAPESAEVAYFAAVAFALSGTQGAGAKALERAIQLGYNREVLRTDDDLAALRAAIPFEKLTAAPAHPTSQRGTR